jgi:hypothetical protein
MAQPRPGWSSGEETRASHSDTAPCSSRRATRQSIFRCRRCRSAALPEAPCNRFGRGWPAQCSSKAVTAFLRRCAGRGSESPASPSPLPLDLLHAAPRKRHGAPAPRPPRYSVSRPATLICAGDRRFAVQICNISQGGMLIFGRPVLLPGHVVEILCGAAPLLRCQVRWVRNGSAGLQFAEPISLEDFDERSRA